jgi:PAS domain S-box-containing protein
LLQEIILILNQFGGGGDPANNAVRFLLAAFFWLVLAVVSSQQYRRTSEKRDIYVALAAAVGMSRELLMFALEYGAHRGFVPTLLSYRLFPPLEHALTDFCRVMLGATFLNYFIPEKRWGKAYLATGAGLFLLLYVSTAVSWARLVDANPALIEDFGNFWGDMAFRVAGSVAMAVPLVLLLARRVGGTPVPTALFLAFSFLFLDEFLMAVNISIGLADWRPLFAPIRHNLGIWAIPLLLATYWGELFRQLRAAKGESERLLAERKRVDDSLRESEARYRTLVENINLGISLVDSDFRVVMVNRAHAALFKQPEAHFVGKPCYEVFQQRDGICPDCHGKIAMDTRRPVRREAEGKRADGSAFASRIHAFPILDEAGNAKGFIEVAEDITELRKAETERSRFQERMQQVQKLESLGILAGGIAHDFNNLLVSMLGNVDLALNASSPESPVRPFLQRIDSAATRAADLTNQMLAYSGKGRFVVEPINLSRLVEEMGHLLHTVISKRALIKFNLAAGLPPVEADATQLRQVVMNLITNASDALGESDGVITVTTGTVDVDATYLSGSYLEAPMADGRYAFVEVSDTGCGMNRETCSRIFDPFFTTKHTGRGLGLAAALGIVRSHKGGLRVYSEPGRGTTFKVLFPVVGAEGAPALPGSDPAACDPETGPRPGCTVLVADDEEAVRDVARLMLEGCGYAVVTAADGLEAVDLFRRAPESISAVVLDMTMPRMGGEEAFRELRRIKPDVRVVLSSGYNEQETVNHFLGKGLAGFIQKPYRTQTLVDRVRQALERPPLAED